MNHGSSRETPTTPPPLPPSLQGLLAGSQWFRNEVGEAGADVFRVQLSDKRMLYLKRGTGDAADAVADEMARMTWLSRHALPWQLEVPEMLHFECVKRDAWLLSTALPGRTAHQWLQDKPEQAVLVVQAISCHLKNLHSLPTQSCPFIAGVDLRMVQAKERLDAGLVDTEDFDEARADWTAMDVWNALQAYRAQSHRPRPHVLTHGDYSLDNLLLDACGRVTGLIDLGRLGLADPYQDLAILWNCLGAFGPELREQMWASYGIVEPDTERLDFYLGLDEMF